MANVRNLMPKRERGRHAGRSMRPFTHSMEEFFENYLPRRWMEGFFEPYPWTSTPWAEAGEEFAVWPTVDILDRDDALVVRAEMPGVKKEDLEITIAGDRLTFEARRDHKEEEKKEDFFRTEIAYGRMYRVVQLPVAVDGDKAKAEVKDGIVEVWLPKVEVTHPQSIKVA
jgi:HSP20 family protein